MNRSQESVLSREVFVSPPSNVPLEAEYEPPLVRGSANDIVLFD